MAELNTYRRCIMAYAFGNRVHNVGDLRSSSDPVVIANPQWWTTLLDSDFTGEGPLELI